MNPFTELTDVLAKSQRLEPGIGSTGQAIVTCLKAGGKILSCGNGGSAATALHLVEELVGRYHAIRHALPAICLNADPTVLTCIGNDFGFRRSSRGRSGPMPVMEIYWWGLPQAVTRLICSPLLLLPRP